MTPPDQADTVPPRPNVVASRLRALFDAALDQPTELRDLWIAAQDLAGEERRALLDLLDAEQLARAGAGPLDKPVTARVEAMGVLDFDSAPQLIGQKIGAFRVLKLLGQGGMATVFLGEREGADFQQQVALKLLRRGLHSEFEQRLFRREQQLLATLSHPNIARLIDGGVTPSGIPYLVIDYVDGVTITRHAATHSLDVRARLRLFIVVCRAVAAAHRSLIVHRDLKPANILVDGAGEVKLLDFGIAKLLTENVDDGTITGFSAYTPGYAAPEQRNQGAISTATDVYALGVVLHELLLGTRPETDGESGRQASTRVNALAASGFELPLPPDALRAQLKGDIDNILLKAMAEEPDRRYANAAELADDCERQLSGQPVAAHPPSRTYRVRKFVRRHRGGVLLSVMFVIGLVTMLGVALWQTAIARQQSARANQQTEIARREAQRANAVRDFVVGIFDSARASLPEDQRPTPESLVAQADASLRESRSLDVATRIDLDSTLGEVWLSLSNFPAAIAAFDRALAAQQRPIGAESVIALRVARADAWQRSGRNEAALAEIAAVEQYVLGRPSPVALRALRVSAAVKSSLGKTSEAIADLEAAAALTARVHGVDSVESLSAHLAVGGALAAAQRYPETVTTLEPLLERWRKRRAPEDARYVAALSSLAVASDALGQNADFERQTREILALRRRIYPESHDAIAITLRNLAAVRMRAEGFEEAEALLREALAMQRRVFGEAHGQIAHTLDSMGVLMVLQRRFEEAEAYYRQAIATCKRARIVEEVCARARNNLGQAFYRQGRLPEAAREMRAALEERRRQLGEDHITVAYSLGTLANVAAKAGDLDEAELLSRQALASLERSGNAGSSDAALVRNSHAQALHLLKRNEDALVQIDRAASDWQRLSPDGKARLVTMWVLKAQILRDLKRPEEARRTAEAAIALAVPEATLSPATRALLRELSGRGDLYSEAP